MIATACGVEWMAHLHFSVFAVSTDVVGVHAAACGPSSCLTYLMDPHGVEGLEIFCLDADLITQRVNGKWLVSDVAHGPIERGLQDELCALQRA